MNRINVVIATFGKPVTGCRQVAFLIAPGLLGGAISAVPACGGTAPHQDGDSPVGQIAQAVQAYQPSDDDKAIAAALAAQASVQDLILFERLIMSSRWGNADAMVKHLYDVQAELDRMAPENAFLLQPATADNIALGADFVARLSSLGKGTVPGVVGVVAGTVSDLAKKMSTIVDEDERARRVLQHAETYPRKDSFRFALAERMVEAMRESPTAATVFDGFLGGRLGVFSTSKKADLVAHFPELKALELIQGDVIPSLERIENQLAAVTGIVAEIQAARAEELAQARWGQRLETAGATVGLVSALVGRTNSELGRQIEAVGSGAIKIADSIRNFKLDKIGGAALTLNVAAVAVSTLSALGATGPTADEVILHQLAAVVQAIEALREELVARLDRIDAKLDALLEMSATAFRKIDLDLYAIRSELAETEQAVADLSWQVAHGDMTLSAMLRAEAERKLRSTNDRCLGVLERTGLELDYPALTNCESDLFLSASSTKDDLVLEPAYDPTEPDHLLDPALSKGPGENARWLLTLLNARFDAGLVGTARNHEAWSLAVDSYRRLYTENAWHVQRIARSRRNTLIADGQALRALYRSMTVSSDGSPNRALFERLIGFSGTKQTVLDLELAAAEAVAQSNLPKAPVRAYDLWGGIDQVPPSDLEPGAAGMAPCSGVGSTQNVPASVWKRWLPSVARNWLILEKPALSVCYDVRWSGAYAYGGCPSCMGGPCFGTKARVELDVHVSMAGRPAVSRRFESPSEVWASCAASSSTAAVALANCWAGCAGDWLQAAPGVDRLGAAEATARDAAAQEAVRTALSDAMSSVYRTVATKLAEPGALRNAATALHAAPLLVRSTLALADDRALDGEALLALFGADLPAFAADGLALRFLKAADAPDLATPERARILADTTAWQTTARTRVGEYLDERAATLAKGRARPSAPDQALSGLELLFDGPYDLEPSSAAVEFPFVRLEVAATEPTAVDLRWADASLPPRYSATAAWTMLVNRPMGPVRLCVERRRDLDRLLFSDGAEWTVPTVEPGFEWLCAKATALPKAIALAVPANQPPVVTCRSLRLEVPSTDVVVVVAKQLAESSDGDGDPVTLTVDPPTLSGPGKYRVTVVGQDGLGGEGSCTTTVEIVAAMDGGAEATGAPSKDAEGTSLEAGVADGVTGEVDASSVNDAAANGSQRDSGQVADETSHVGADTSAEKVPGDRAMSCGCRTRKQTYGSTPWVTSALMALMMCWRRLGRRPARGRESHEPCMGAQG